MSETDARLLMALQLGFAEGRAEQAEAEIVRLRAALTEAIDALHSACETRDGDVQVRLGKRWMPARNAAKELHNAAFAPARQEKP